MHKPQSAGPFHAPEPHDAAPRRHVQRDEGVRYNAIAVAVLVRGSLAAFHQAGSGINTRIVRRKLSYPLDRSSERDPMLQQ
jgi:hypothetical protein